MHNDERLPPRNRARVSRGRFLVPHLEALEDRLAPAVKLWTGTVDSNWWNAKNWNGGVPGQSDIAFIGFNGPGTFHADPEISYGNPTIAGLGMLGGGSVRYLTIDAGNTLTVTQFFGQLDGVIKGGGVLDLRLDPKSLVTSMWSGGTLGPKTLILDTGTLFATLRPGGGDLFAKNFTIAGRATFDWNQGEIFTNQFSTFTNNGTFTIEQTATWLHYSTGTGLINNNVLQRLTPGATQIGIRLDNYNNVLVQPGAGLDLTGGGTSKIARYLTGRKLNMRPGTIWFHEGNFEWGGRCAFYDDREGQLGVTI
jgi:hypothetical protein